MILTNREALATPLILIVNDEFGTESFDWEDEILRDEVAGLVPKGEKVPPANFDKISAMTTLYSSDLMYNNAVAFNQLVLSIGGSTKPTLHKTMMVPTVAECSWALYEIILNAPLEKQEELGDRFSYDVKKFMKVLLEYEGFASPPKQMEFLDYEKAPKISANDDQDIIEASWRISQAKKEMVQDYMKIMYGMLVEQLSDLELKNGSTDDIVKLLS